MYCKKCGAQVPPGPARCGSCGADVSETTTTSVCRGCGHGNTTTAKFCKKCGLAVHQTAALDVATGAVASNLTPPQSTAMDQTERDKALRAHRCANCGAVVAAGAKFCKGCGGPRTSDDAKSGFADATQSGQVNPPAVFARSVAPVKTESRAGVYVLAGLAVVLIAGGIAYWKLFRHPKPQAPNVAVAAVPSNPAPAIAPQWSPQTPTPAEPSETQNNSHEAQSPVAIVENKPVNPPSAPGASTPPKNRANSAKQAAAPIPPPYQVAHTHAEEAFAAAQYIEPQNSSALYWARLAGQQGDPTASQIEQHVYEQMKSVVLAQRASRNYDTAVSLLSKLTQLFPDRPELQQMASSITEEQRAYTRQMEQQRKAEELKAQTKEFRLQHRHFMGLQNQNFNPAYGYCAGVLRITPDGTAKFDCTQADARGRCDHLTFTAADIRELQLKNNGSLHLVLRSGNFDFFSSPATLQAAADALHALGHQ